LHRSDLGQIDAVYDRASLTALAEGIRRQCVAQLRLLIPDACKVFLLTIEDAQEWEAPDQAQGAAEEINSLYSIDFDFGLVHVEGICETNPDLPDQPPERAFHKIYRMSAKSGIR
jgi:thiopurine S-methyltransferase